jgi:uncharacterized protein (TIGR02611 family)
MSARLGAVRDRVRSWPGGRLAWRIGVTVAGVAVVVLGVVLLPLPGPGWLVIFAGLGVLATEYAWAAALLQRVRRWVSRWTAWVAGHRRGIAALILVLAVAALGAIVASLWWLLW